MFHTQQQHSLFLTLLGAAIFLYASWTFLFKFILSLVGLYLMYVGLGRSHSLFLIRSMMYKRR